MVASSVPKDPMKWAVPRKPIEEYTPDDHRTNLLHMEDRYNRHSHTLPATGFGGFENAVDDPAQWNAVYGPDSLGGGPFDFEFTTDTTTLPTNWVWFNQGAATYQERFGAGSVTFPASVAADNRGLVQPAPTAASWTAVCKAVPSPVRAADFQTLGLYLQESGTGKLVVVQTGGRGQAAATPTLFTTVQKWDLPGTYNSDISAPTSFVPNMPRYFKIVKNAANSWDFALSVDGVNWYVLIAANDISGYLTPDYIGFGGNTQIAGAQFAVGCEWFRIR